MASAGIVTGRLPAVRGSVKGTLVIARMKYLRAQGQDATGRVLDRLAPPDRQALRGMLLPSTWYPGDLLARFETAIAAELVQGDRRALFLALGQFSAETNLGASGIQRPYLREDDPHFLLRNVPRMYAAQHSAGTRTYEQTGAGSAVIRTLGDGGSTHSDDCLTTIGWLRRAIELSGGAAVRVEELRCRVTGAPWCEFACSWL